MFCISTSLILDKPLSRLGLRAGSLSHAFTPDREADTTHNKHQRERQHGQDNDDMGPREKGLVARLLVFDWFPMT